MELCNNPAKKFAAAFLSRPPRNFLPKGVLISTKPSRHPTSGLFVSQDSAFLVAISLVEQLGADTNIIAQMQGHQFPMRLLSQYSVNQD
jgi:multiple sugar transport system ATP-binding protein